MALEPHQHQLGLAEVCDDMDEDLAVSVCGCGFPLYPSYGADGKRTGVTHKTYEEEDHHMAHFSGIRVELPKDPE